MHVSEPVFSVWQGNVKDEVAPLIMKEFGIAKEFLFFLEGSGTKTQKV